MGDPMRIRATEKNGEVVVKVLMRHDMDTGLRKNSDGEIIPAHYINEVVAKSNGKIVFQGHFGPSVSKDPYLNFKYKGEKGEKLTISWKDNKGDSRTDETMVR